MMTENPLSDHAPEGKTEDLSHNPIAGGNGLATDFPALARISRSAPRPASSRRALPGLTATPTTSGQAAEE